MTFTTTVANNGLEKARTYLNQVPQDCQLNVSSEGHEGNPSSEFLGQIRVYTVEKNAKLG